MMFISFNYEISYAKANIFPWNFTWVSYWHRHVCSGTPCYKPFLLCKVHINIKNSVIFNILVTNNIIYLSLTFLVYYITSIALIFKFNFIYLLVFLFWKNSDPFSLYIYRDSSSGCGNSITNSFRLPVTLFVLFNDTFPSIYHMHLPIFKIWLLHQSVWHFLLFHHNCIWCEIHPL